MYDTILVAVDGSETASTALDHALQLATAFDATVHAIHVVDPRVAIVQDESGSEYDQRYQQYLGRHGRELLETVTERADSRNQRVETALETGIPHETVVSYADEHDIDLIVMGTHGRSGLDRMLLGSVTERVVRLSDVPVLAVHGTETDAVQPYERILVPTDGSEHAEAATAHAIDFARAFDAEIHVLSVLNLAEEGGLFSAGGVDREFIDRLDESTREAAERVAERAREEDISAEVTVEHGLPHKEISTYVAENDIDFVAMGTHGRAGLRRYLLGSVTERVLRSVDVPVLTVSKPED
jgi:nucleotide-binding universal stress UspA family protein